MRAEPAGITGHSLALPVCLQDDLLYLQLLPVSAAPGAEENLRHREEGAPSAAASSTKTAWCWLRSKHWEKRIKQCTYLSSAGAKQQVLTEPGVVHKVSSPFHIC